MLNAIFHDISVIALHQFYAGRKLESPIKITILPQVTCKHYHVKLYYPVCSIHLFGWESNSQLLRYICVNVFFIYCYRDIGGLIFYTPWKKSQVHYKMTFFKIYEIICLLLMGKILKNWKNLICYLCKQS